MLVVAVTTATAQSATKSPYSQFGLGVLSDRSQSMTRGMDGLGVGTQQSDMLNTLNPASYGGIDSLTMIFDAGITGQLTNFKEGATRQNATSANFEYIAASFRAWRNVGIALGVLPLTNVGYSYMTKNVIDSEYGTLSETYSGDGGLHEVFMGVGWRVLKPLSVGINAGYVWGDIDRTVLSTNSVMSNLMKSYSTSVASYKLDIGAQWKQTVGSKDIVTLGATMGIGHNLHADATLDVINVAKSDTTSFVVNDALELPWSWAVGMSWNHANSLTLAADAELQQWGKLQFPAYESGKYLAADNLLKDRLSLKVGAEWVPNAIDTRHYLKRVHYRFGVGLSTPYYKINGQDGPRDFSVSLGFGLPFQHSYNSRSLLNISGQWVRSSAKDFITENMFRINIGITFNERWFAKWKVE